VKAYGEMEAWLYSFLSSA